MSSLDLSPPTLYGELAATRKLLHDVPGGPMVARYPERPEASLAGEDWEYQVRHRAYELWNAAGRPDGKHLQFWEAAEQELKRLSLEPVAEPPQDQILDARPDDRPSR